MSGRQRIVVAMSGGVDSSTVAGLLVEAGHEVIGLAMRTHSAPGKHNRACCTPDDMRDARRVADLLGIRFYVLDYEAVFAEAVVRPFAEAYRAGRTPNPCVTCNDRVKFRPLLQRAQLLGADALATGHYAQVRHLAGRRYLARAADADKDQAYFLYRLSADQLAQVQFPLGQMCKAEVRAHAARLGLPVAEKAESQEICFVGADGYAATVERLLPSVQDAAPGAIVDAEGRQLGAHAGVHHFTIGQRRGLGIGAEAPMYVTELDAAANTVRVGPRAALLGTELALEDVVWTHGPPAADTPLSIQRRHRGRPQPLASWAPVEGGRATAVLDAPAPRAAPGQAAVLLHGDVVVGGGVLAAGRRPALPIVA